MKIIYKEVLNSTNSYAKENMGLLEDKTFIYCNTQTEGKGQLERVWVSDAAENLYLTIVLKPTKDEAKNYPLCDLTIYTAEVLVNVLKKYGVKPEIKHPNDILINGGKIAGILAQSKTQGQTIKGIALGVGVNLNMTTEQTQKIDQKATSLNLETGGKINREDFLKNLAEEFLLGYDDFIGKKLEKICD